MYYNIEAKMDNIDMSDFKFVNAYNNADGSFTCLVCSQSYKTKQSIKRHINTNKHRNNYFKILRDNVELSDNVETIYRKLNRFDYDLLKEYDEKGYSGMKEDITEQMKKTSGDRKKYIELSYKWQKVLDINRVGMCEGLINDVMQKILRDMEYIKKHNEQKIKDMLMDYVPVKDLVNIIMEY